MLRLPFPRHESLRTLADEDLMELMREGDARALEVIFTRHGNAAFSLAYRMCGRRSLAEDVVQEAFLSMWRGSGRYEPGRGSVRSWTLAAVRHKAIDSFRHESAMTGRDVADDAAAAAMPARERTDDEVERREDVRHVREALTGLPNEQRRVIELAYFGGFTHTEIARMLDLPTGTVKGRMRLGLTKMRLALSEVEEGAAGGLAIGA
jgi:RNA polymerase sigma-70 factor (ECF subfamily)